MEHTLYISFRLEFSERSISSAFSKPVENVSNLKFSISLICIFRLSLSSLRFCIIKKLSRWSEILSVIFPAFRLLVHAFINTLSIREGFFLPTILVGSGEWVLYDCYIHDSANYNYNHHI